MCRLRRWMGSWYCCALALALAFSQHGFALPKDIPKEYRKPLELIFGSRSGGERRSEGRPIRLQLLHEMDNVKFFALVASTTLQQNPQGRCAIVVSNHAIGLATWEKLQEQQIQADLLCKGSSRPDPFARVVICSRYYASRSLAGQSFTTMLLIGRKCWSLRQSVKGVHAKKEVYVYLSFLVRKKQLVEIDFAYGYEQAYQDGKVAALQAFLMPMFFHTSSFDTFVDDVVELLRQKSPDWGPMFICTRRLDFVTSAIVKLQRLGISARVWPSKMRQEKEREDIAKALAHGDLQVVFSTNSRDKAFLPKCVCSIAYVSFTQYCAETLPDSLFTTLSNVRLEGGSSCTFLHVCGVAQDSNRFVTYTKLAAMALPFWPEREKSIWLSMDEIGLRLNQTAGVSVSLLQADGHTAEVNSQNVAAMLAEQRAKMDHIKP